MLAGHTMTTKAKKLRGGESLSARPRTVSVSVSHPTVQLATEQVQRVFETIETMHKRRQIDAEQFRAAEHIRRAHLVLYGSPGGVMDFTRTRGGSLPGSPPPLTHLCAAETLSQLRERTYPKDYRVILLVVIEGYSLEQAANDITRRKASRAEREEVGRSLRNGLTAMAEHWWGSERSEAPDEIRVYRSPDARPVETAPGTISRGKTVHATGRRVFRNK